ncbi:MAG: hypothetical protein NT135_00080 [Candidatus Berkelbacteria bacterium]|nr:hypothetical protein [Candidatus Berkelbacteria bacterium]
MDQYFVNIIGSSETWGPATVEQLDAWKVEGRLPDRQYRLNPVGTPAWYEPSELEATKHLAPPPESPPVAAPLPGLEQAAPPVVAAPPPVIKQEAGGPAKPTPPADVDIVELAQSAAANRVELGVRRLEARRAVEKIARDAGVFIDWANKEVPIPGGPEGRTIRGDYYLVNKVVDGVATPEEVYSEADALGWTSPWEGAEPFDQKTAMELETLAESRGYGIHHKDRNSGVYVFAELCKAVKSGKIKSASEAFEIAYDAGWTYKLKDDPDGVARKSGRRTSGDRKS